MVEEISFEVFPSSVNVGSHLKSPILPYLLFLMNYGFSKICLVSTYPLMTYIHLHSLYPLKVLYVLVGLPTVMPYLIYSLFCLTRPRVLPLLFIISLNELRVASVATISPSIIR